MKVTPSSPWVPMFVTTMATPLSHRRGVRLSCFQESPTAPTANVNYAPVPQTVLQGRDYRDSPTVLCVCLQTKSPCFWCRSRQRQVMFSLSLSGRRRPWKVMLHWAVLGTPILNAHLLTLIGMLAGDNSGLLGLSSSIAIKARVERIPRKKTLNYGAVGYYWIHQDALGVSCGENVFFMLAAEVLIIN